MNILEWADKRGKTFSVWDFSVLKTYCLLIGVVIGAYIPDLVKNYLLWFIILIVLLGARLVYKVFKA